MDATDAALGVPVLVAEIVFDATAAGCLDEVEQQAILLEAGVTRGHEWIRSRWDSAS